jgi:hypothetical protein
VEPIRILKKDKTVEDVIESSDQLNLKSLSKSVTKHLFPKTTCGNEHLKSIFLYFVAMKFTAEQIAGILGSYWESQC